MTIRRRLYPTKPAQQTPARRIEVEGVLQPIAPPAAPATPTPAATGGCDVTGVMWVAYPNLHEYGEEGGDLWYERAFPHVGPDEQVGDSTIQSGDAAFIYVSPPYFYSHDESDPPPPSIYAGVALGPQTRNVQWSAERSGSLFPVTVDTSGPVALVTLTPFQIDGGPDWFTFENVTLTARCGDAVVGVLRMQVRLDGW